MLSFQVAAAQPTHILANCCAVNSARVGAKASYVRVLNGRVPVERF